MAKPTLQLTPKALVIVFAAFLAGCVDVPNSGITPPDYEASMRVIYADPALASATLSIASNIGGTSAFSAYADVPAGAFGTVSSYTKYKAGAKKMYVKKADGTLADADTSTVTLETETVRAIIVMPKRAAADSRLFQMVERNTFRSPGITDSARVRFVNCIASKDTVDVWRIRGTAAPGIGTDNLRYAVSTAFVNVPRDSTWRFFVTRYTGSTAGLGDTVTVVGASNKQYTIVLCDSLARVKVLKIEDQ
jgi:hypothetical protein